MTGASSSTLRTGITARGAVVLATGARHRKLGVAREDELAGSGVCYCATCDGAFYAGRDVAVAGGGDAALQDALLLSNSCNLVYIIHRRETFRAEAANVDAPRRAWEYPPRHERARRRLLGEGELSGVAVEDAASGERREIAVDGLFVAVGHESDKRPLRRSGGAGRRGLVRLRGGLPHRDAGAFRRGGLPRQGRPAADNRAGDGAAAAVAACRWLDSRR